MGSLPKHKTGLQFIRLASWPAVVRAWKPEEVEQPGWIRHYHQKGYDSWAAWRTAQFAPLQPAKHQWRLYEVIDPMKTIPLWHGASFGGWRKKYYGRRRSPTFATIAANPKIRLDNKILGIQGHFPRQSYMVGVFHRGRIYVIEGMHRACAIALAVEQKKPVTGQVWIFLMRQHRPLGDLSTPIINRRFTKN